jgi:hypothetical protein
MHAAVCQQVGDAVGQHPGLAGTRAGDDEQRRALVGDGGTLLGVQVVQQGVGVHGQARGGAPGVVGDVEAAHRPQLYDHRPTSVPPAHIVAGRPRTVPDRARRTPGLRRDGRLWQTVHRERHQRASIFLWVPESGIRRRRLTTTSTERPGLHGPGRSVVPGPYGPAASRGEPR